MASAIEYGLIAAVVVGAAAVACVAVVGKPIEKVVGEFIGDLVTPLAPADQKPAK
jgi:hypothetical protein